MPSSLHSSFAAYVTGSSVRAHETDCARRPRAQCSSRVTEKPAALPTPPRLPPLPCPTLRPSLPPEAPYLADPHPEVRSSGGRSRPCTSGRARGRARSTRSRLDRAYLCAAGPNSGSTRGTPLRRCTVHGVPTTAARFAPFRTAETCKERSPIPRPTCAKTIARGVVDQPRRVRRDSMSVCVSPEWSQPRSPWRQRLVPRRRRRTLNPSRRSPITRP